MQVAMSPFDSASAFWPVTDIAQSPSGHALPRQPDDDPQVQL